MFFQRVYSSNIPDSPFDWQLSIRWSTEDPDLGLPSIISDVVWFRRNGVHPTDLDDALTGDVGLEQPEDELDVSTSATTVL